MLQSRFRGRRLPFVTPSPPQCAAAVYDDRDPASDTLLAAFTPGADFFSWPFENRIPYGNARYLGTSAATAESGLGYQFHASFCSFLGANAVDVASPVYVFQHIDPN
jgi:hypothetical protein